MPANVLGLRVNVSNFMFRSLIKVLTIAKVEA